MKKLLFIFLVGCSYLAFGQTNADLLLDSMYARITDTTYTKTLEKYKEESQVEPERTDSHTLAYIFGCYCCLDTILNGENRKLILKDKAILSAYKNKTKVWSVDLRKIIGNPNIRITCVMRRHGRILVMVSDYGKATENKEQQVVLNPKNGRIARDNP